MRTFAAALLCVAAIQATAVAQDWGSEHRWRRRDGVQIRVGKNYYLPADQVATRPVVVVGGSATIDGRIEDDLVVIGGPVRVGPNAHVRADIVAIGGGVTIADTAEVTGEVHDVSVLWPQIRWALSDWAWGFDREWWPGFRLAGTILRFTLTLVAACFIALIAPRWIGRIEARVIDAPIASGVAGFAAEVLFTPALIAIIAAMVITIVGIPLLLLVPFAVLAFVVTWLAGFAAVAAELGGRMRGARTAGYPTVADVAFGVMLLFLLTFVGNLLALAPALGPLSRACNIAGFIIEYFAWTVGLGAALIAPLRGWSQASPPPIPTSLPSQDFGRANA